MEFRQHRNTGEKKPTRYYSNRQEKAVAKAIGGRQTSNSGATASDKGDVTDQDWLMECKTCMKDQKSFTLQKEWFDKNLEESIYMKKNHKLYHIYHIYIFFPYMIHYLHYQYVLSIKFLLLLVHLYYYYHY